MSTLELVAAALGALAVWLVVLRNVWNFPVGIVMVIMYSKIFYDARLYSDMLLQSVFLGMQIMGWWNWLRGEKGADNLISVRNLSLQQWLLSVILQVLGTLALGFFMQQYTQAALPYLDAFTAVMSIIAQWWLNKRYVENWIFWIVVDTIYLYIYPSRGLYATAILYFIFLLMAISGYMAWRKKTTVPK